MRVKSQDSEEAITSFAEAYAAQNERDYAALADAVKIARLAAITDI